MSNQTKSTKKTLIKDAEAIEKTAGSIKKTADDAMSYARSTAESVQRELQETAGEARESVQKVFMAGLGALAMAEEEGSKLFSNLVKKGEDAKLTSFGTERLQELRKQVGEATEKAGDAVTGRVKDAQYAAGEAADKAEGRVQTSVAGVLKRLGVPTRDEISELTKSVERLTLNIEKIKQAPHSETPVAVAVGGGWYEIRIGDAVVEKVQGKDEAEAEVARIKAEM